MLGLFVITGVRPMTAPVASRALTTRSRPRCRQREGSQGAPCEAFGSMRSPERFTPCQAVRTKAQKVRCRWLPARSRRSRMAARCGRRIGGRRARWPPGARRRRPRRILRKKGEPERGATSRRCSAVTQSRTAATQAWQWRAPLCSRPRRRGLRHTCTANSARSISSSSRVKPPWATGKPKEEKSSPRSVMNSWKKETWLL